MTSKPTLPVNHLRQSIHLMVLWGFAVAQPMYDLLRQYPPFLTAHHIHGIDLMVIALVSSIALPLLLVIIKEFVSWINRGLGYRLFQLSIFGLLCLLLAPPVNLIPDLSWPWRLAILVLLTAGIGMLYFRQNWLQSLLSVLSVSILLFPILWLFNEPVRSLLFSGQQAQTVALQNPSSTRPHVVLMVFDELPGNALMQADGQIDKQRFPNLAALAKNANWYPDATTVDTRTERALPAILTGNHVNLDKVRAPVARAYPDNLFTLLAPYYTINAYEPMTDLCPRELCPQEQGSLALKRKIKRFVRDSAIVYAHQIMPPGLLDYLPPIHRSWGDFTGGGGKFLRKFDDLNHYGRHNQIDDFINSLQKSVRPGLHFLHANLPHMPYIYFPDGRRYHHIRRIEGLGKQGQLDLWGHNEVLLKEAEQRLLMQLQYIDNIVGRVVRQLETQGINDNTLLIITSDHGVSIYPGDLRRGISATNLIDIASVPLLIKQPGQVRGQTIIANAQTVDILPTILEIANINTELKLSGRSLLTIQKQQNKRKFIDDEDRRLNLPTDSSLYFKRRSLKDPVENGAILRRLLTGHSPDFIKHSNSSPVSQFYLYHDYIYQDVDTSQLLPAQISGELLHADVDTKASLMTLGVVINDKISVITQSFYDRDNKHRFSALAPPKYFRDGDNKIELFEIIEIENGSVVLQKLNREKDSR